MIHRRPPLTLLLLATLVAGLASGCGGDDDSTATADTISKAEFVKQAEALCEARGKEVQTQAARILADTKKPQKVQARKMSTQVAIPAFEREIRELEELGAPAGEKQQLDAVIDEIQETVNRFKKSPDTFAIYPYRHSEQAAAAYGIPSCGKP